MQDRSAIVIDPDKRYLVKARLLPLAQREGFCSIAEMVSALRNIDFGHLHRQVVEAMTMNETSFFRDLHPFEALRTTIIPDLIRQRTVSRELRIWCAACSTGQEPYSVAMLIRDQFPELSQWDVSILATDLSLEVLEKAKSGSFNQIEINRGVPKSYLDRYFCRVGLNWKLNDTIRQKVDFQPLNLIDAWQFPPMDIIFIRNVLIYFNVSVKKAVLSKVKRSLRSDGYLFLGIAESTYHLDESFNRCEIEQSSVYRLQ